MGRLFDRLLRTLLALTLRNQKKIRNKEKFFRPPFFLLFK